MPISNPAGGGIARLSQLEIDADKDWQAKEITNLRAIAGAMAHGDVAFRGAAVLERLIADAGKGYNFLRSRGPGLPPEWCDIEELIAYMTAALNRAIDVDTSIIAPDTAGALAAASIGGWTATPLLAIPEPEIAGEMAANSIGGWAITPPLAVPAPGLDEDMLIVHENYRTGDDGEGQIFGANWEAQTFTPSAAHNITKLYLKLGRFNNPGAVTVGIRATDVSNLPTGADLTSSTFDGNDLPTSGCWLPIAVASLALSAGARYAIVLRAASGDASNYLLWRADFTSPGYAGGARCYSSDGGSAWAEDTIADYLFEEGS